ncbi:head-tail connector protein [Thalassovita sp.]|uniref:head-tail connector protein n=1 Tax=Thalassovita sp. TaxID=1979401 RepID=UPI00288125E4|nr:head-tail connector protein [Thalassovita sp.]MDF1801569.1 head-tail connector protein [Thalassovita sp.]
MMLVEETQVPQTALPVADFKSHLRLGSGFAEDSVQDAVLESFLRAAMAAVEARTGKVLIEREFSWTLSHWRDASGQILPVAPVSAIAEVALIDRANAETVLDAQTYVLRPDQQRPRLCPVQGLLPTISSGGSVRVRFLAGYGPDWSDLPNDLAQAVLMLGAHYYEYRHETALSGRCMPFGVTSLLERYRTIRVFAGRAS